MLYLGFVLPKTEERKADGLLAGIKNFKMKEGPLITSDNFALNPSVTQIITNIKL